MTPERMALFGLLLVVISFLVPLLPSFIKDTLSVPTTLTAEDALRIQQQVEFRRPDINYNPDLP